MAEDLHDALTDVHGIGDAKAEEIAGIVEEYGVADDVAENVVTAYDYLKDGQRHQAEQFLRNAYEAL